MPDWQVIAVWIVSAGPLAALLFALSDWSNDRRLARGAVRGALLAVLICAVMLLMDCVQNGRVTEVVMMRWIELPGTTITFGARCDGLALILVVLSGLVLWLVLESRPTEKCLSWLILSWIGVTDLVTASNLGQVTWGWFLSAWAASEFACTATDSANRIDRPVWLVQRLSDTALLIGVALTWIHGKGSLSLLSFSADSVNALPIGIPDSLGLYVLIAAIGRCAQIPLSMWLETERGFAATENRSVVGLSNTMVGLWNVPDGHQVADRLQSDPANRWHRPSAGSVPSPVLAWWLCAVFLPTGFCLLLRFEPILVRAENTRLLALVVGSFTLLLSSASAVAQNSWPRVLGQVTVAHAGLVLVALSLDHPTAVASAMYLLVVQSLLLAVLIATGERGRSPELSRVTCLAAILLASGLWGRHAVADAIWQLSTAVGEIKLTDDRENNVALGGTIAHLLPLAVGLICVAEVLLNLALFRAIFWQRRLIADESVDASLCDSTLRVESDFPTTMSCTSFAMRSITRQYVLSWCAIVLLGFAVGGGLWLGIRPELWRDVLGIPLRIALFETAADLPPLFGVGSLLPLSVAGAILAWSLYARPSPWSERLAQWFGPFARLSRNRFYWDDLYFLLWTKPTLDVSNFLAWFDRSGAKADKTLRDQTLQSANNAAEPLTNGQSGIYALTTFSAVAVLTWMLLLLR